MDNAKTHFYLKSSFLLLLFCFSIINLVNPLISLENKYTTGRFEEIGDDKTLIMNNDGSGATPSTPEDRYRSYYAENDTLATLSCNKTKLSLSKEHANTTIELDTENWNFSGTTINFFNIQSQNTLLIETSNNNFVQVFNGFQHIPWGQGFIPDQKYNNITKIELYLTFVGNYDLFINIYTAIDNPLNNGLMPGSLVCTSETKTVSSGISPGSSWIEFLFNDEFLNASTTQNDTFFVVLNGSLNSGFLTPFVEWGYAPDDTGDDMEDAGDAVKKEGSNWELFAYDLQSKVYVTEIFYPEDIQMRINDTIDSYIDVKNNGLGKGIISLSKSIINSNVSIQIHANKTVSFNYLSNSILMNTSHAFTQFYANYRLSRVVINITINSKFISSLNRKLNITLQDAWNITSINKGNMPVSSSDWERFDRFLIINATDGKYSIKCSDNNYIDSMTEMADGSVANTFFYLQNLTINGTFLLEDSNYFANLSIINRSDQIVFNDLKLPNNYQILTDPYNMTRNGLFTITLTWFNGTSIGFRSAVIEVLYQTDLYNVTMINGSRYYEPGEEVYIDAYFNNTDLDTGILNSSGEFMINMTSQTQYDVLEHGDGYYNITIYTNQLIARNYTLLVWVEKTGYEISNFTFSFRVGTIFNSTLNLSGYYGNQYIENKWWIKPNPYFDDQTHKVQIYYRNGTDPFDGIYPATIYAYPNWTSDFWYGNPYDIYGRYDISIDTNGLHEGDCGEILIIATSQYFDTKEIKVYLEIDEIPESLLSFDISGFEEITAYEGETIQVAASFVDEFHSQDIIFQNTTNGNVSWSIIGTDAADEHIMDTLVHTYVGYIDLPLFNISGGESYNITITGKAAKDYATKKTNITLNVLEKENTNLHIFNISEDGEIRIGKSLDIFINLTFSNGTSLRYKNIQFNLSYFNNSMFISAFNKILSTNGSGIAEYFINEVPDNINLILINASYSGTEKISPVKNSTQLSVYDKYNIELNIITEYDEDIRVGKSIIFNANLTSLDFGPMMGCNVVFNITYLSDNTSELFAYEARVTNATGIASFEIEIVEDLVREIKVDLKYLGNKTFHKCSDSSNYSVYGKYNASLSLISSIPAEIMIGDYIQIGATLKNFDKGTYIANTTIKFEIHFDNDVIEPILETGTTNINGTAWVVLEIPQSASNANSFWIMIKYDGGSSINKTSVQSVSNILILTPAKLFMRYLPYILIILAIAITAVLIYQYVVRVPRIRRKRKRIEQVNQKFSDILNVQHLMIIHKDSGGTIYNYSFQERSFDPDLISGFLTAIASFQIDSGIKKQKQFEEISSGFELKYHNFIILMNESRFIRVALILDQKPAETLRKALNEFIELFEEKYHKELENFTGNLKRFRNKDIDSLIEKVFEASLMWPHRVNQEISKHTEKDLSSLESSLLTLALTIQKNKNFFMAPSLIDAVQEVRRESYKEILFAFDLLRKREIFIAFPIEKLAQKLEEFRENEQS